MLSLREGASMSKLYSFLKMLGFTPILLSIFVTIARALSYFLETGNVFAYLWAVFGLFGLGIIFIEDSEVRS